jgi:GGDEF domain-containing protein
MAGNNGEFGGMDADNMRQFRDLALLELKRAERYRNFLSLLVLNLSEFLTNAGRRKMVSSADVDRFMETVVNRVRLEARETDMISPFDNDRLVMLLPETDQSGAKAAAERFQDLISEFLSEFLGSSYEFDVPLEISSFPDPGGKASLKSRLKVLLHEN